ncbi:hypothetical protein DITRI_Ditri13aG0043000 [Diplodiscus trichospermus]
MNTSLPIRKHSKLLCLINIGQTSYIPHRHLCSEPDRQPTAAPEDDESKITQAVQLLLETPREEWSSSQPLQSLLFPSSPPSPRFLTKITRSLASTCQAIKFFKHLRQNSPYQDTQFLSYPFQALLEQAGRELDAGSRLFELYQASNEWEIPLTVNAVTLFIRYFGRLGMRWRVEYALNVLDEMLQPLSEVPPNDITGDIIFYRLVKSDSKGKGINLSDEDTIKLVLKLGKHNVFPNTNWLVRFINSLCRRGKMDQAWDVLHELLGLGATLEAPPINAILTWLARSGDVRRMNTVLAEMKESEIEPDVVTIGILINLLCKFGRVDDAMEVLNKMGEGSKGDGVSVEADVIIYNTLIDGLCKVGRPEEGLHLMERMKSMKGLAPNTITYTHLIDGFCKVGEIDRGKELFDQMNEEGVSPNVISLNAVVNGMCRNGRINSAIEFFSNMQGKGLKGDVVTYTTLITACCNGDNIDKAIDLFDQMLSSGCFADAIVNCSLISSFCRAGRMDDASNVLSKLKEAGFRPNIGCYNALVSGFCKVDKVDKAYEIIKEMEKLGMKPDSVTYNTLISYFCKTGNFGFAQRVMKQMIKGSHVPTVATYGALMHAYCLNGKNKEAMKLFDDMSSMSMIPPNTTIFNMLIKYLCKNNDVNDALCLMDDMKAKGVKPNTTTYNAMFKGLKDKNLLDEAFRLMKSMIEHACNPDSITMEILTEWLSAVGEAEKLKSFIQGCKIPTSTA